MKVISFTPNLVNGKEIKWIGISKRKIKKIGFTFGKVEKSVLHFILSRHRSWVKTKMRKSHNSFIYLFWITVVQNNLKSTKLIFLMFYCTEYVRCHNDVSYIGQN